MEQSSALLKGFTPLSSQWGGIFRYMQQLSPATLSWCCQELCDFSTAFVYEEVKGSIPNPINLTSRKRTKLER